MASVINAAEDDIFADFCREIGVANIREYEERQLKLVQAESEARLQFDTQIARLTHRYEPPSVCLPANSPPSSIRFAQDQLKMTEDRITTFNDIIDTEGANLERLEGERTAAQEEIAEAEEAITILQEELKQLSEVLEEKTKKVEEVKKTTNKAAKALDQALKEVATHVSHDDVMGTV